MNSEKEKPEKTSKKEPLKSIAESTMNSFDKAMMGLGRKGYVLTPEPQRIVKKSSKRGAKRSREGGRA